MIGEYNNGTFALLYVHGPGVDEPLVSIYGNGNRYWFHADERGSVIAGSDPTGAAPYVNTYDEYGRGGGSRAFRFGFTGQIQFGPDRLYFKARMYDPGLGRFMQPDPIGYDGGMNLYGYVKGDPINSIDPSGTIDCGLESNWRSGNCADRAVGQEIRKIGESNGYSAAGIRAVTSHVLNLFHGRTGYAETGLTLLQIEGGAAAKQSPGNACPGRFQCEDTPTDKMRTELIQLFGNSTFQASVRYIEGQSNRTGNEWGFTGRGRGDFTLGEDSYKEPKIGSPRKPLPSELKWVQIYFFIFIQTPDLDISLGLVMDGAICCMEEILGLPIITI